jgi:hypothetical protein
MAPRGEISGEIAPASLPTLRPTMQNRTHPGDRRTVQIVQARTTRDRIRCNTTQCRTRGSRRQQRRRLKQAPPATPPAPRPRGPVLARAVPLKPSLRSAPGAHKGVPRLQSLPGLIPRRLRRGCSFQAKHCFSPTETQLPVRQSPGPVPIPRPSANPSAQCQSLGKSCHKPTYR